MNNKYTFPRFSSIAISLLFIFFALPSTALADAYSSNWFSTTLAACDNSANMNIGLYFDDGGTTNDDFWQSGAFIEMNNGSGWVNIANIGQGGGTWSWNPNDDGGVFMNPTGARTLTLRNPNSSSENTSADEVFYVYITIALTQADVGKSIQFRVNGIWEDGGSSGTETVIFLQTPDLSTITAQDAVSCNGTQITWSMPATLCAGSVAEIYRNNSWLHTLPASNLSYIDAAGTPGTTYQYKVRFNKTYGWFGFINNRGGFSTENDGTRKTVPSPPDNLQATNSLCNTEIRLTWEWPSASPDNFRIYRNGALITPILGGSLRSYTDNNITRGLDYIYTIQASNNCGWSSNSNAVTGISPVDPAVPAGFAYSIVTGSGVQLTWPASLNATSYQIERSLLGGGGSSFFDPNPVNGTSYFDASLVECQTYEYRLRAFNDCVPGGVLGSNVISTRVVPDLSNTFNIAANPFQVSKGYYSDRVELSWTVANNENFINQYKIYRKIAGSPDDSIILVTLNSGSNIHNDFLALAGVLYEYTIIAETQCEATTIFSNALTSIGFRSPFGTVSGQVSYTGGIAVKNVKISANSSSGAIGNSLSFNGSSSLSIPHKNTLNTSAGLTLEMWFKPSSQSSNFTLAEKVGAFSLRHIGNNYTFSVTSAGGTQSVSIPQSFVSLNNYNHFTATLNSDTLRLFLNGNSSGFAVIMGAGLVSSGSPLTIGNGFQGKIDEFRFFTKGKNIEMVQQDFLRQMNGSENELKVYLKMNEAIGNFAYDFSRIGLTNFNRNHASFLGAPTWSADIPTQSQLSIVAITDLQGNYVLNIPYGGIGETFVLTPSYLVHNFTPSTRALFIGEGSAVFNNIDFTDISSFTVQGSLFYANTSCAVDGASLKIDGNPVVSNGAIAQTDAQGNFLIQVPIGQHNITVEKNGHFMSVGRFPATGTYNFQDDLAGISFIDSTLLKVVGRVVGGLKEASYIPGLGKSTNNIGTAQIILKSQQGNGCFTDTILTNASTGEFTVYVPPLRYIPTVTIPSNPTINFGVLSLVDLSAAPAEITRYDTIGVGNIDSIKLNKQLDYVFRVNPQIVVKDKDLTHDFIGDTSYTYIHPNGDSIVRNLRTNPLAWPLFTGVGQESWYTCLITAFEAYENLETGILDTVPTTDGRLVINNDICIVDSGGLELSDINTLDSLQYLYYKFKLGTPNFNQNVNIPQYNFVKTFEINVLLPSGTSVAWKPDVFNGNATGQFNAVYDQIFRGYVLGTKSDGQQFVTAGPQVPEYVLRDPPGSNSAATRGVGTTKTTSNDWSWSLGGKVGTEDKILLGTKITTGLGVATETDIENNLTAGFSASVSGGNSGNESVTITNTQEWSTNSSSDLPGAGSDLYIGKSKNVTFGISKTLDIVPDSICTKVECIGNTFNSLSFANTYGLSIVPGGYETQFIYNQNQITGYLIPDLIDFRNALLQSDPRYVSNLGINDPNYAKNNDDIAFNSAFPSPSSQDRIDYLMNIGDSTYSDYASSYYSSLTLRTSSAAQKVKWEAYKETNNPGNDVLSGASYTFNAVTQQDSLTGDSVRWINNQIKHWEDAIMLNEWEKVKISDPLMKDKLKQVELTKLVAKYKVSINAFEALNVLGGFTGGIAGLASILNPAPGAAFVGYASFAITTGAGIGIAEVYEEVLQFENQKEIILSKYGQTPSNYSISGGNTFTSTLTHESASTYTSSVEYGMSVSLELEVSAKVSNIGVGYKKSLGLDFASGRDWSNTTASSETVSFSLNDPDQGDYFSVDVFPSLLGWGPVFKLRPGGATACPHEDAQLTKVYMDAPANAGSNPNYPNFELNARTFQIDKPTMSVAPSLLTNVPITNSAVFNLTINNESEAGYSREYTVATYSASNPFGAIVRIDGAANISLTVPPASSVNKVLSVSKGPGPVYNYDSILVVVYAPCQYAAGTSDNGDIVDSIYISAHFLPACTDINFAIPNDQWVLNNFNEDTMPVAIIDYDINFFDFNSIRLDYKATSQSQWTGLQTFYKDTAGLNNPTAQLIPTSNAFTLWDWETDQIVDGAYDLRLVSQCTLVDKISDTHTGLMDRINPHPFGTPSPADGILDSNDDISIRFNEPVDLGSLTSLNFDVRGVINGSETTHASNLYFDGVDDYVEITGGAPLQQRDFTIEFSVKRGTLGSEAILTQGPDGNEQIYIGFTNGNQLQCKINGISVNSLNTYVDNDWHYFAVSYNYTNEEIEIFEASNTSTASIVNSGGTSMYEKYAGADKMLIGKDAASGSYFTGNLDDVRIWNTARTLSEFSLTKSIQLGSNEPGLLYNWRFDEAEGLFAKDHVRSRDGIIFGAEWTVEPGGSAIALDGVDDYLRIQKGDVNITKGMDFTLEFWYNSTQASPATLVSTGKGDGIGADSLYAWNIAKDAAGLIHVYHNGEDFVATNTNTFDGEWHHFALILNRQGNLTSYLDGNLELSVQATPYKDLGGPAFYLGARGYYMGTVETTDNYFDGSIDEFRFWDASRKFEQISRDKNNRMKGDEFALRMYMPFEDYQIDPTGIAILTPGLNEQVDAVNYLVTNPNGAILTAISPKIKVQRPIESIAFTYSVNNDQIIITPTTNQALIENVTLDITVKNVKDLRGNVMESPKTWIAYMDKNQVVWQDDLMAFDKAFGAPLSFSSAIANEGGAAKNFTIENLPDWLTVTPVSGIIQANAQRTISFVVDPNVNIGDYSQDIHLLTDFGFPEKLTIDLTVREEEPSWTVNPADFDFSMSIIGYLEIKDVVSTSEEDILAVFVGDECRGLARMQYLPQLDRYLVFLDVYSNVIDGEDLTFKIWDASSGIMFTQVNPLVIAFVENNLIGTINNPQLFETNYEIAFDIPLVAGWNWVSDFLFDVDSTDLDKILGSLESVTGDEIKTLTHGFSSYLDEAGLPVGWSGAINKEGIRAELGYKLRVKNLDTLIFKGDILDPTSRTIQLTTGWNWIGFISIRNQSLSQALGNHNPTEGDLIKAKSQFAVYNNQLGWVGSLQVMTPGAGYMYKSVVDADFVYPFAGMFKSGNEAQQNFYANDTWNVDDSPFAANMTSIIKLGADCDYLVNNQQLTLGVFDGMGKARGISPIEMNEYAGITFATIAGDIEETLILRVLDNNTKTEYNLEETFNYTPNMHLGSLERPMEVRVTEETCFKMQADAGVLSNYFKVYPTVIGRALNLDYIGLSEDLNSTARLYNVWGQKVWESNLSISQGFNRVKLDLSQLELAAGVYHFILNSNGSTESVKLISK